MSMRVPGGDTGQTGRVRADVDGEHDVDVDNLKITEALA